MSQKMTFGRHSSATWTPSGPSWATRTSYPAMSSMSRRLSAASWLSSMTSTRPRERSVSIAVPFAGRPDVGIPGIVIDGRQKIVQDSLEQVHLPVHQRDDLARRMPLRGRKLQDLDAAGDGGQRPANLVGKLCQEVLGHDNASRARLRLIRAAGMPGTLKEAGRSGCVRVGFPKASAAYTRCNN